MRPICEYLFELYKGRVLGNKQLLSKEIRKFGLSQAEESELYTRLVNYQIKKFGNSLRNGDDGKRADYKRINQCIRSRRREQKKYWGLRNVSDSNYSNSSHH